MLPLLAALAVFALPDTLPPAPAPAITCVAEVVARRVECAPDGPGARVALRIGRVDAAAGQFAFDVAVQNLVTEPIGTHDGSHVTGMKLFFHRGPTASAVSGDTASVTVRNPDGRGNFTGANQPYFFYSQVLKPQEVSARKRWVFHVPRSLDRFTFSTRVLAGAPSETPMPATAPDTVPNGMYAESNWLNDTPCIGRAVGNVVIVVFHPDATQPERQAAMEYVGGTVVGGRYGGPDGLYYVKIADRPSAIRMCDAINALSALPQVEYADPILPAPPPAD